jgi:hypothetical protein
MATKNVFGFSEIFRFAEEKFGLSWNLCNSLFFDTEMIKYRGNTNFYKFDMLGEDEVPGYKYDASDEDNTKAVMSFPIDKDQLLTFLKEKKYGRFSYQDEYPKLVALIIINVFLIENNVDEALILGD